MRLAPMTENKLWIQAGKIPQPFGAFPERWYPFANPLIGNPFMYSYVTSLRPDNIPAGPDDLLSQRGNGLAPQFQGGGTGSRFPGVPMIEIFKWAAGGVGYGSLGPVEWLAGATSGTLSHPGGVDEGDGAQIIGRARYRPSPAFNAGVSVASGRWLDDVVEGSLGDQPLSSFKQTGIGGDFNYARGVRGGGLVPLGCSQRRGSGRRALGVSRDPLPLDPRSIRGGPARSADVQRHYFKERTGRTVGSSRLPEWRSVPAIPGKGTSF